MEAEPSLFIFKASLALAKPVGFSRPVLLQGGRARVVADPGGRVCEGEHRERTLLEGAGALWRHLP